MTYEVRTHRRDPVEAERPRTLRRDAAENRRRLLDAAREVFALRGIEAGVEEVAQAAGVGIGTLYRRFPTKDALIAELVHEFMEQVVALAREAGQITNGQGLTKFVYAMGELQARNRGCLARIWTDDATTALRQEYRSLIAEMLVDAQAHGTIRDDAALTDIDLLFWSLRGIIETTGDLATPAWQRQAAICLAGLHPSTRLLANPPLDESVVERSRQSWLAHGP